MVDTAKEAHSGQYLQHHLLLGALLHHMGVLCDAEGHECNEKEPRRTRQTALLAPCSPRCGILLIKRRPMKSELIWVRRQQRI